MAESGVPVPGLSSYPRAISFLLKTLKLKNVVEQTSVSFGSRKLTKASQSMRVGLVFKVGDHLSA